MRNWRSCIKAAIDFVSPEALGSCRRMADDLRECALRVRRPAAKSSSASDASASAAAQAASSESCHDPAVACFYADKLQGPLIFLGGAVDAWLVMHPEDRGQGAEAGGQ